MKFMFYELADHNVFYIDVLANKLRLRLISPTDKLLVNTTEDCYTATLSTEYVMRLENDSDQPLPNGVLRIFLRSAILPNNGIQRCHKHRENGRRGVMQLVESSPNTKYIQLKSTDTSIPVVHGIEWRIDGGEASKAEMKITFECTNNDVSRKRGERSWRFEVMQGEGFFDENIDLECNLISVLRKFPSGRLEKGERDSAQAEKLALIAIKFQSMNERLSLHQEDMKSLIRSFASISTEFDDLHDKMSAIFDA